MLMIRVEAVHRSRDHGLWDGADNWKIAFYWDGASSFKGVIVSLSSSWCRIVVEIAQYEVFAI